MTDSRLPYFLTAVNSPLASYNRCLCPAHRPTAVYDIRRDKSCLLYVTFILLSIRHLLYQGVQKLISRSFIRAFLPRCMECRRGLAMRILSVRLYVCQTRALWQNERKICPEFYSIRTFSLISSEEEWLVEATPSTWNIGSIGPRWSEIADFELIFARTASAVTRSEKSSINANRKSTTRFLLSRRWSSYVAPKLPKNSHFPCKITLRLKKVCYKVSLCENCQRQSCKALIGLSIRAKMIGGGCPIHVKIWRILTHPLANRRFSICFRS